MKKRLFSLILAASLMAAAVPTVCYAAEITGDTDGVTTEVTYTHGNPSTDSGSGSGSGGSSGESSGSSSNSGDSSSGSTDSTATRNTPAFCVTIPGSINLNETKDLTFSASKMDIERGKAVRIYLDTDRSTSNGVLPLTSPAGDVFECFLEVDGTIWNPSQPNPVVCTWNTPGSLVPYGSNGFSFNTVIGCPPTQPDGVYTGHVYFNVRYE